MQLIEHWAHVNIWLQLPGGVLWGHPVFEVGPRAIASCNNTTLDIFFDQMHQGRMFSSNWIFCCWESPKMDEWINQLGIYQDAVKVLIWRASLLCVFDSMPSLTLHNTPHNQHVLHTNTFSYFSMYFSTKGVCFAFHISTLNTCETYLTRACSI